MMLWKDPPMDYATADEASLRWFVRMDRYVNATGFLLACGLSIACMLVESSLVGRILAAVVMTGVVVWVTLGLRTWLFVLSLPIRQRVAWARRQMLEQAERVVTNSNLT